MKKLTESERRAVREILVAKSFDEALHRTPESILERLPELPGADEIHDLFDADMFPDGLPQPPGPKKEAKLVKTHKAVARRGRRKVD